MYRENGLKMLKRKLLKKKDFLGGGGSENVVYPLTIVAAPMGFGKTTIVSSFLEEQDRYDYSCLSMGKDEVDASWVWQKFLYQEQKKNSHIYKILKEVSFPRTKQEMERCFINIEKAIISPYILVFDDYQECNSKEMNHFILELIYREIPNLFVILISRIYPDLPYEELELKGYCRIINQRQLTLSKEEIKKFFLLNGADMTESQLVQIADYSDGWMAAAALILMDYQKNGTLKLSVGILRLMKNAIFDKLPGDVRQLLIKMSIFNTFTLEEACYTAEIEITDIYLNRIIEQTGFIQYDFELKIYKMHALLKALATSELEKDGLSKKELYQRYAQCNEEQGNYIQAIFYYNKADNPECILRILDRNERYEIFDNAPVIIEQIFRKYDKNIFMMHPVAYFSYIYSILLSGKTKEGTALFNEVKLEYGKRSIEENSSLRGELYIVEAFMQFNNLKIINNCLKKAYAYLGNKASEIFNSLVMTNGVPAMLGLYYSKEGALKETVAMEKEYAFLYMRLFNHVEGGWDSIFDAEYFLYIGEIEKAQKSAQTACEIAKFRKQICMIISSYYILMRCDIYNGDRINFDRNMNELEKEMEGINRNILRQEYEIAVTYLYGLIGRPEKMVFWLKDFMLEECNYIIRCSRYGCICYGFNLIFNKKWVKLEALSEEMLALYGKSVHFVSKIYAYMYKTIARYYLQDMEGAAEVLNAAIKMAQMDQLRIPFIEFSVYLYPLLDYLKEESSFVRELLPYCEKYKKGRAAFDEKVKNSLTDREKELMDMVQKGYSNKKIAEKLCIALVTVEKTLTLIYRKLGVTNRTAAAAKYQEL